MGLCFVPFPGLSSSDDQVFDKCGHCDLLPPPSLPLGFLVVQLAHLLRWMFTVQNPKKSWLAMKPACNLVDNASLGLRLPPSGSACPCLPVTGRGWAGLQPASSAWFFVLCAGMALFSVQFSSVNQSCSTLCNPMNCSTPGLPAHHQLPEFTQTHVHGASDAIQPSHPLSSSSSPAPNPSQHQSLFQRVNSSHEVAKVLEFQL